MISIILPTFNEKDNLSLLYQQLSTVIKGIDSHEFEFVFIDDCSQDDSATILEKLAESVKTGITTLTIFDPKPPTENDQDIDDRTIFLEL